MPRGTRGADRTRQVSARVNVDEYAAWREAALAAGHKELGAWVRRSINRKLNSSLGGDTPAAKPIFKTDRIVQRMLHGMANNLNQLTKLSHVDGRIPDEADIALTCARIRAALNLLVGHPCCPETTVRENTAA